MGRKNNFFLHTTISPTAHYTPIHFLNWSKIIQGLSYSGMLPAQRLKKGITLIREILSQSPNTVSPNTCKIIC